jgi:hypothetical protein
MLDILKIDKNGKDIVQYKEEIHSKIEKVYEEVRYYGDLIRQKRESENRKRNHKYSFKMEDLVWLYAPKKKKKLSKKLIKPWIGPFKILEITYPNNAKLQRMNQKAFK